ncbi:hypothetical protein FC83_GL001638 [Agrilactobacillus composti DSM 18527 = JCM 14202]|uniref:Uncharacterized protein n=1 Tax=Agrilactobacillus composti DSM 18527 = JCM 14202 TaxID=1423734 RepID=X0PPS7_9LACO|nr:hypothetical protein [Agrilactobacillus composti]KRM30504.1 hypothetical protein FC83_GL001638 [Agrilactobacillus composti DSM 18527 = JCM 14202]GAF39001.1 hypothetical protein JCM14202_837 [Agrilactobacillus composti DSM 18527 = JCM 14202]
MNRKSILILSVTLVLTAIFYLVFGWGQGTLKVYDTEPATNYDDTSNGGIYSQKAFISTLQKFKRLDLIARLGPVPEKDLKDFSYAPKYFNYKYDDFLALPGLRATKTINSTTGEVEMCTTMTPQGVTIAGDYLITSAYDHDGFHNSVLYVQNLHTKKYVKTIVLDGRPHVGGITYDPNSNQVWVCGRRNNTAEVFAISMADLEKYDVAKTKKPIAYTQRSGLGTLSRASFITYHVNSLFVGFFNPAGKGHVQRYELDKDGNIAGHSLNANVTTRLDLFTDSVFHQDTIKQVQGLAFYDGYAILSQSFGPGNSKLYIFKEDRNKKIYRESDAIDTFEMPAHLEQISAHDGRLYMVFESAAYAYRKTSHNHIDRVVSMNLKDFIQLVVKEMEAEKNAKH